MDGTISGSRTITLDGTEIVNERQFLDEGSNHSFTVNGHPAVVRIESRFSGLDTVYKLVADGREIP
jgi:hypothetical protein